MKVNNLNALMKVNNLKRTGAISGTHYNMDCVSRVHQKKPPQTVSWATHVTSWPSPPMFVTWSSQVEVFTIPARERDADDWKYFTCTARDCTSADCDPPWSRQTASPRVHNCASTKSMKTASPRVDDCASTKSGETELPHINDCVSMTTRPAFPHPTVIRS